MLEFWFKTAVGTLVVCVDRKRLMQLARELLVCVKVPESLVAALHSCYVAVQPDEEARIQELVEIIADVHEPIVMTETTKTLEEQRQHEMKVRFVRAGFGFSCD